MAEKLHFNPEPIHNTILSVKSTNQSVFTFCGSYDLTPVWTGEGLSLCFYSAISSGLYCVMLIVVAYQAIKIRRYVTKHVWYCTLGLPCYFTVWATVNVCLNTNVRICDYCFEISKNLGQ